MQGSLDFNLKLCSVNFKSSSCGGFSGVLQVFKAQVLQVFWCFESSR